MSNEHSLYRQEILEHYRNPQNFGKLQKANISAEQVNELCGDEMQLWIKTDKSGKVTEVKFTGRGCALSIASASYFTEFIKGKNLSELKKMKPEEAAALLGVEVGHARMKCVLLPYDTLKQSLKN